MRFNATQLEELKQYEDRFSTAVNADYYRNLGGRTLDRINNIYAEAEGKTLAHNWSCSHCILTFLKTVGAKYFADLKEYNKQAEQLLEILDEVMDDEQGPEETPDEVKDGEQDQEPEETPEERRKRIARENLAKAREAKKNKTQ